MKKYLLLFSLILLPYFSQSQVSYEYVSHQEHGNFQAIDVDENGYVIAVGSTQSCAHGYMAYFDQAGHLLWEKELDRTPSEAMDVFFDQDHNIVVAGNGVTDQAEDVGRDTDGIYLLKLDTLGNILFYLELSVGSFLHKQVYATPLPDANYLIGVGNTLSWVSATGDSLRSKKLTEIEILDLEARPDSNILVLSKNEALWLDREGNPLRQYSPDQGFIAACQKGDTTWVLDSQSIWVFTDEQLLNPEVFSLDPSIQFGAISPKRNGVGVFLSGRRDMQAQFINFSEGLLSAANITTAKGSIITEVVNKGNDYYFAGRNQWEITTPLNSSPNILHGAFLFATTAGAETSDFVYDISIDNIVITLKNQVDTLEQIYDDDDGTLIYYALSGRFSGVADITNYGNTDVDKFVLFADRQGGSFCVEGRYFEVLDPFSIKAGETQSISFDFNDVGFFVRGREDFWNRCFFVAAPNQFFDQEVANNSTCLSLLSNTTERRLPETAMRVAPNPALDQIQVQLEAELQIQSLELFNLNGQQQQVPVSLEYNRATIQRGQLAAGLYLLRVQTNLGVAIRKVVFR